MVTKGFFDIAEGWKEYFSLSLSLSHSERLSTRGAIQAVMECLTETAICSQLASRDLFGQWAQPSLGKQQHSWDAAQAALRAVVGAPAAHQLRAPEQTPLCALLTIQRAPHKKKAVSLHSALGWDPKKYSEAARRGGNTLKYDSAVSVVA